LYDLPAIHTNLFGTAMNESKITTHHAMLWEPQRFKHVSDEGKINRALYMTHKKKTYKRRVQKLILDDIFENW